MSELIIIRGLPGSGKSTLAKTYTGYLHYEPDHILCDTNDKYRYDAQLWDDALSWVEKLTDFALARGESVVVSDVFCEPKDIEPYRMLAEHHGAKLKIITCHEDFGNKHSIPVTVLKNMLARFQPHF